MDSGCLVTSIHDPNAGALALVESPGFAKLRHVNLHGSALSDATLRRLFERFDGVGFDSDRLQALRGEAG